MFSRYALSFIKSQTLGNIGIARIGMTVPLREVKRRKVFIGTAGLVAFVIAGMLAGNVEAAPLTGCCYRAGNWMCGMACGGMGPSAPSSRCCKQYGKWHCPCRLKRLNEET